MSALRHSREQLAAVMDLSPCRDFPVTTDDETGTPRLAEYDRGRRGRG